MAKHPHHPDVWDFYKIFFLCETIGSIDPKLGSGMLDARFFPVDDLPALSLDRVLADDIKCAVCAHNDQTLEVFF